MKLISIKIENFKNLKFFEVKADQKNISITGANATGKSSIIDSLAWLLFGKNAEDNQKFSVQPIHDGEKIHNIETKVSALFDIAGKEVCLSRSISEKWVKKRGGLEPEFSGYETTFSCDDVDCSRNEKGEVREKDYQSYIEKIVNPKLAKIILNGENFLSDEKMNWQDRRKMLADIAGIDTEVLQKLNFEKTKVKNLAAEQKTIAEKKSEEIKTLKNLERADGNIQELKEKSAVKQAKIELAEKEIIRIQNSELLSDRKKELNELEIKLSKAKASLVQKDFQPEIFEMTKKYNEIRNRVEDLTNYRLRVQKNISEKEKENESRKETNKKLLDEAKEMAEKLAKFQELEFDGVLICPFTKKQCSQSDALDNQQELFNSNKAETEKKMREIFESFEIDRKKAIEARKALEANIEPLKADVQKIDEDIVKNQIELQNAAAALETKKAESANYKPVENPEVFEISELIERKKSEIKDIQENSAEIVQEYRTKIESYRAEKADIEKQIAQIEADSRIDKNINQAETELKEAARLFAEYSKKAVEIDAEIQNIAESISVKVNNLFQFVSFRMFETQVNGEIKDCCIPLILGVPYSDANTASKINASIDISNVFSKHFSIEIPCFVDNSESVEKLIESRNQIIVARFVAGEKLNYSLF